MSPTFCEALEGTWLLHLCTPALSTTRTQQAVVEWIPPTFLHPPQQRRREISGGLWGSVWAVRRGDRRDSRLEEAHPLGAEAPGQVRGECSGREQETGLGQVIYLNVQVSTQHICPGIAAINLNLHRHRTISLLNTFSVLGLGPGHAR